ncbi:hypothetical protein [Actinomadura chibensis]|uniref:Uncharacterized protein n=1 Tax=Actinomadura chibensis TaxID=392828 RepID=A0A5D0NP78_9ACTN|nr:hypothetical protein [Actinomadura chibensis]TYB46277.1 hypothetical protein FXF69_13450 [Actinomadura chibensis]
MTISETMARLRRENPGWTIDHVEGRAVPWLAVRESRQGWVGGHSAVEAQLPGYLGRLMAQAVDLAALASGKDALSYGERMGHLTALRKWFPEWAFEVCDSRPVWHGQRNYVDYAERAASVTEVRGNDPKELALLLLRLPQAEAGVGDVREGER